MLRWDRGLIDRRTYRPGSGISPRRHRAGRWHRLRAVAEDMIDGLMGGGIRWR